MGIGDRWLERTSRTLHRNVLGLVLAAYAAAAVWPAAGMAVRSCVVGRLAGVDLTAPMALLAGLLFNAGLGTTPSELAMVGRRPRAVVAGWAANLIVPLVLLGLLSQGLSLWHDTGEAQALLTGLTIVAAMPVAGSSAAYAQNANGSGAVSLGLVLSSTLLSPLTTPAVLRAFEQLSTGPGSLAVTAGGAAAFLAVCVAGPSLAGLAVRAVVGSGWAAAAKPLLRLANTVVLIILCYVNAAVALPRVVADPDWDYLGLTAGAVAVVSVAGFGAGWLVGRLLKVDDCQRRSLVYGLGMSNNGTGLVLGTSALAGQSDALLPIIVHNLAQHVVAAAVHRRHVGP